MSQSNKVKLGFKAWKAKTATTNVSLKAWAKAEISSKTELAPACEQWFANKKNQ